MTDNTILTNPKKKYGKDELEHDLFVLIIKIFPNHNTTITCYCICWDFIPYRLYESIVIFRRFKAHTLKIKFSILYESIMMMTCGMTTLE